MLLERAITGIGARSSCAIYPLNNIKRDIMKISDDCLNTTNPSPASINYYGPKGTSPNIG